MDGDNDEFIINQEIMNVSMNTALQTLATACLAGAVVQIGHNTLGAIGLACVGILAYVVYEKFPSA